MDTQREVQADVSGILEDNSEYKFGFITDIDADIFPKGRTELL